MDSIPWPRLIEMLLLKHIKTKVQQSNKIQSQLYADQEIAQLEEFHQDDSISQPGPGTPGISKTPESMPWTMKYFIHTTTWEF